MDERTRLLNAGVGVRIPSAVPIVDVDRNVGDSFFTLAANNVSLERYRRELDKCVLLCANCHHEIHAGILTLDCGACSSTG